MARIAFHPPVVPLRTLSPDNEIVQAGRYDATTLSAVDTDLGTGNIKNGITMFGFAGSADVFNISDATAIAAEVIEGETFYAISGGIRTGTMPIQNLSPDNDVVAAGYYAATSLSVVDAHLAAANIKSGIEIFGFTGPATVQEIGAADAVLADVKAGKTFFSITGGIKTGNLATVAITDVDDDYPAGYHVGNIGGLVAIDEHLVTANIKSGITIFGIAGHDDVRNVSDANAVLADVMNGKTFYAQGGARKTGNLATVALAADSNAYPAGYHIGNVGGLDAIDLELVTANIKSGITIFNVAGHNDVRNISDGDLLEAEAPTGKFFYAVAAGRRTGTGTKTLNPANENVAAGYYAATTLSDVDAHLAAVNIKSGIEIFGFTGPATVQEIGAADAVLADVKAGKTFFSITGGIKTGDLATVALNAGLNEYPEGYHAGEASLTAVDAHLAADNIKDGVEIFGVTGTVVEGALAQDVEGDAVDTTVMTGGASVSEMYDTIGAGAEIILATKTLTFDASSLAFAVAFANCKEASTCLRLYMGGVLMQTSAAFGTHSVNRVCRDFKALSDELTCIAKAYNPTGGDVYFYSFGLDTSSQRPAAIAVGSVKLA